MNFIQRQNHKIDAILRTFLLKDQNTKNWESLKDKFKGERVFLLGNGPSLNRTPLFLLKDEYTLCLNRFYMLKERLNWDPYFYMCIDPLVVPDIYKEINEYKKNLDYAFFLKIHNQFIEDDKNVYWMTEINPVKFRYKLPLISRGAQTVAIAALQVLMYLGFEEIYLLGIDQNYTLHTTVKELDGRKIQSQNDDDPNHFDPRYFGKGRKYHQPDKWATDRMMQGFRVAKENADKAGIKIINAGVGGQLEVYERIPIENLFKYSADEKLKIFSEIFGNDINLANLKSVINNPELILENTEKDNSDLEIFTMPLKSGESYIMRIIFSHIPFGPFDDKYIFIKRDKLADVIAKYFK